MPNATSSRQLNHQPVTRGSIDPTYSPSAVHAADVREDHGQREHEREHHDERLHELDVRARAYAAECRVETGAREERRHRHERLMPKIADAISPIAWNCAVRRIV